MGQLNIDGRHCWAVSNVIFDDRRRPILTTDNIRVPRHMHGPTLSVVNVGRQKCRPTVYVGRQCRPACHPVCHRLNRFLSLCNTVVCFMVKLIAAVINISLYGLCSVLICSSLKLFNDEFLENVNYVTFAICYRNSVCRLSVVFETLVRHTQPVKIFGDFFHNRIAQGPSILMPKIVGGGRPFPPKNLRSK